MLAGSATLALHGAVVLLVVVVVGKRVATPPPPAASLLTLVEVVDALPGPPTVPPKGTSPTAPHTPTVKKVDCGEVGGARIQPPQHSATTMRRRHGPNTMPKRR
jgi:hypothetical protein